MIWLPIALVVALLLLGLWAFVLAPPEAGESAERARRQAQAASLARRLAEAYDDARPLALVAGAAPAPGAREWVQAGAPLEGARAVAARAGQDLLDLLAAATGDEVPRATVRGADADAHRAPTFAEAQHPLAGRVDVIEAAALRERVVPLLRRWAAEGREELARALVEFAASDLEAEPDPTAVSEIAGLIERGACDDDDAARQAAALVRPLLEAAEAAAAGGASLALLWLPEAGMATTALRTIAPASPRPVPEAPPADLDAARIDEALRALGAELEARGLRAGRDPDGAFTLEGTPLRVRVWPYAVEDGRVDLALEVEASIEGERRTFRLGFAACAPTVERAQALATSAGAGLLLPPLLDACAPPRADVLRWSPPGRTGDVPVAYELHLGPVSLQGHAAPEQLERLLARHPLLALRDALAPALERRVHLVDLRGARTAGGAVEADVRLDGAPWAEGARLLGALPWPDDAPHVAVRAVAVLRAARL